MRRFRYSRLKRQEEGRNIRQAFIFSFLTVLLLVFLAVFGFRLLTKMALFLGKLKNLPPSSEQETPSPLQPPLLESIPEATNSAGINISGFAGAKYKVELFLRGEKKSEVKANDEGGFSFKGIPLEKGVNEIYARAVDEEGNTSQHSEVYIIDFDNEPPKLIISEPQDGTSFFWPQQQTTLKGETEPNVTTFRIFFAK